MTNKPLIYLCVFFALFSCKVNDVESLKNSQSKIVSFTFEGITPPVTASIDTVAKTITVSMSDKVDLTSLVPTISISANATIAPASGIVQNFAKPVEYLVTAEDGSTSKYLVVIKIIPTVPAGWVEKRQFPGPVREEAIAFTIGNKGYFGLGYNVDFGLYTYYNDLWEYTSETDTWKKLENFPGKLRGSAVAFSVGANGYVATGRDDTNIVSNEFYQYDPAQNKWTKKTNFPGKARHQSSSFVVGETAYLIGGDDDKKSVFKDVWAYDYKQDKWSQKGDMSTPVSESTAFVIGNNAYVIGGNDGEMTGAAWIYNNQSDKWNSMNTESIYGSRRENALSFVINGKGYFVGGANYSYSYKELLILDPNDQKTPWTRGISMPAAIVYGVSFVVNGKAYITSGRVGFATDNNRVFEYNP